VPSAQELNAMVTIIQKQKIWEIHEFELTHEQYKEFKTMPKEDRENFLSDIGGSPAEYENESYIKYEVRK
jgi:HSP90 family molecular chaperone